MAYKIFVVVERISNTHPHNDVLVLKAEIVFAMDSVFHTREVIKKGGYRSTPRINTQGKEALENICHSFHEK